MQFNLKLYNASKRAAGPDSDMNDLIQIYYSATRLLADYPDASATESARWEALGARAEATLRAFTRCGPANENLTKQIGL